MEYEELLDSRPVEVSSAGATLTTKFAICIEESDSVEFDYQNTYSEDPNVDYNKVLRFCYDNFPLVKLVVVPDGSSEPVFLDKISVKPTVSIDVWEAELTYVSGQEEAAGTGNYFTFSVSTIGEQENIKYSRYLVSKAGALGHTPGGVIGEPFGLGIRPNSLEGMDVPARAFNFQLTVYLNPVDWNPSLVLALYAMTPSVNDDIFIGFFPPGTCLYKGISASGQGFRKIPVTFEFAAKENASNWLDPPFSNFTAKAWQAVDYEFGDFEYPIGSTSSIKLPIGRYVSDVIAERDFSIFGVG